MVALQWTRGNFAGTAWAAVAEATAPPSVALRSATATAAVFLILIIRVSPVVVVTRY
ncbi:hypothetical protein ACFXAF_08655 [Kitasatospora sp. NPDC059463]|uniref:hypothetical protein n=1 Tax=unclassified Kitasatospora TaxID=2633591 RepID=UPI003692A30E